MYIAHIVHVHTY